MGVRASVDLELTAPVAFDAIVEELVAALKRRGLRFDPGPDGRIMEGSTPVGRVTYWKPGEEMRLEWRQANWEPDAVTEVEVRFEPMDNGTRVTLDHGGFGGLLRDRGTELAGWFADEVASPMLRSMAPARLGDWITDRQARRPTGKQSRDVYRDPLYHRPNFLALLKALALTPMDRLLEVGCGGGAFLQLALRSGCLAAAIDHSSEMVQLASATNSEAIRDGRLEIHEADAVRLPFPDGTFTCAVCTGVFGFLPDPDAVLREIHRVLAPRGRFALYMGSKELRGTPAAPEPVASRVRFYEDDEIASMAREAGFSSVRVERPDLTPFARELGLPDEHLAAFSGRGGQFLLARKG